MGQRQPGPETDRFGQRTSLVRDKLGPDKLGRDKLGKHESEHEDDDFKQAETTTTTAPNRISEIEELDGHTKQIERKQIGDDRSREREENDHNARSSLDATRRKTAPSRSKKGTTTFSR